MERDIIYQDKVVGTAKIEQEGLFLIIRCRCTIIPNAPLRIILYSQETVLDLGLCMTEQHGCGLLTRIAATKFPKEPVIFCLEDTHYETFVPLHLDAALPTVQILKYGRFTVENGVAGIMTTLKVQFPDR